MKRRCAARWAGPSAGLLILIALCSVTSAATDAFVVDNLSGGIFAYTDTTAVRVNPSGPIFAQGMALDARGNLLLATPMSGQYVLRLDPETEELTVVADTLGPYANGLDVYPDASGDVYVLGEVADRGDDRASASLGVLLGGEMPPILVWEFLDSASVDDIMVFPGGERKGHVFALSTQPGYLLELERTAPTTLVEVGRDTIPGNPTSFAITRAGDILVLDYTEGMFLVGEADTLVPFGEAAGPGLSHISASSDGTIYVTNESLGVVHRFDRYGAPVTPPLTGQGPHPGAVVAPEFAPTHAGEFIVVEPLDDIVVVYEEVSQAGYTMASSTRSALRVSPMLNRLPDHALLPGTLGGGSRDDEFNYIQMVTSARHKRLIQMDVYEEGERFFFANGVADTFRDFTVEGSIEDARGTIPRFSEQAAPGTPPGGNRFSAFDHIVEVVLVDDDRTAPEVVERKISRTDTSMSVPKKPLLATDLPYPGDDSWGGPDGGGRGNTEPCPWGQIRRLREYLARAVQRYRDEDIPGARLELEDMNAELRHLAGWCIPDSSDARLGNLVGEILAHSKTLHWSLGQAQTGIVPGGGPGGGGVAALALSAPQRPVAGSCSFTISGPEGARAELAVYSASGRLVAKVFEGVLDADDRTVVWGCRDSHGRQAASGVYFARLTSGDSTASSKVVVVR